MDNNHIGPLTLYNSEETSKVIVLHCTACYSIANVSCQFPYHFTLISINPATKKVL